MRGCVRCGEDTAGRCHDLLAGIMPELVLPPDGEAEVPPRFLGTGCRYVAVTAKRVAVTAKPRAQALRAVWGASSSTSSSTTS